MLFLPGLRARLGRSGFRRLAASLICLSACALPGRPDDPFAAAGEAQRPSSRAYRVRLEVLCGGCTITYSIAARILSSTSDGPIWRMTFDRYPRFPEAIRLSASGEVESARIYVDGEVVASQERRPAGSYGTLTVEAVVPPPSAEPPADTLDVEGVSAPPR